MDDGASNIAPLHRQHWQGVLHEAKEAYGCSVAHIWGDFGPSGDALVVGGRVRERLSSSSRGANSLLKLFTIICYTFQLVISEAQISQLQEHIENFSRLVAELLHQIPHQYQMLMTCCLWKNLCKDCLSDAFFQTLMHEPDIEKTAIMTNLSLFEWVVMPQGACNSLATQQCQLNEVLWGLLGNSCEAYVDDIIVWVADAPDLNKCLQAVLTALCKLGLVCSPTKLHPYLPAQVMNFHIIWHIPEDMVNHGPVYGWWPMALESLNGHIKCISLSSQNIFQEQVIALCTLLCGQLAFLHLNKVFLLEAAMNNKAYLEEVLDGFKYSLKSYMMFSDGSSGGLLVRTMAMSTFKNELLTCADVRG